MAKVGAQRAAELTGRSKSTIQRAMKSGKLSFELDANNRRLIDVSELDRAFGLKAGEQSLAANATHELEKATSMLESERLKMRIKMLEDQLETAHTQIDDLKAQRDQWQKQASQVLLTSQYTQKQAEELREEIRKREARALEAKARRQKKLEEQMNSLRAENQNAASRLGDAGDMVQGLWKKIKKTA